MDNLAPEIQPPLAIGVDVEWTKVAAGFVDSQGSIFGRARFPTDKSSPKATLDCIAQAVDRRSSTTIRHPVKRSRVWVLGSPVS